LFDVMRGNPGGGWSMRKPRPASVDPHVGHDSSVIDEPLPSVGSDLGDD